MRRRTAAATSSTCVVVLAAVGLVGGCAGGAPEGFPDAQQLGGPEVVEVVEDPALWDLGDCPPGGSVLPEIGSYDGAQLDYRADEASVFVAVHDLGDAARGEQVVADVASTAGTCTSRTDVVTSSKGLAREVAAAVGVGSERVATLTATVSGTPGAAPFQAYERAVVALDDGRLITVSTVHPPAEDHYDLAGIVAAAVTAAREVDGVPSTEGVGS